jgi:hypothetical protein
MYFIIFYLFSQVNENEEDSDDENFIPDVNDSAKYGEIM